MRISQENFCQIAFKDSVIKPEQVTFSPGQELGGFQSVTDLDDFSNQLFRVVANNYFEEHPDYQKSFHWFKSNHLSQIVDNNPKNFHGRRELKVVIQEANTHIIKKIEGVELPSIISFKVVSNLISNNQWKGDTHTDVSIYVRNIKRGDQIKPYLTMTTSIPDKKSIQKTIDERNIHSFLNWHQITGAEMTSPLSGNTPGQGKRN